MSLRDKGLLHHPIAAHLRTRPRVSDEGYSQDDLEDLYDQGRARLIMEPDGTVRYEPLWQGWRL